MTISKKNIELILTQNNHIYRIYFQDQEVYRYFFQTDVQEQFPEETHFIKLELTKIYNKLVQFSHEFEKDRGNIAYMMKQFRGFHTDRWIVTSDTDLDKSYQLVIVEGPFRGLIPIFQESDRHKRY